MNIKVFINIEGGKMKKKILSLFSILIISMFMVTNVSALELTQAGDDVIQEGDYNSLRLAAGKNVTSTANIDGISLIAGNNITVNGHVSYGFYAGNSITINESVDKDMFAAGNLITIGNDAIIGRDAFIAGNKIIINSNIGRDLRAGGSSINISGITINGDAYLDAEEIILNEDTVINGKLTYLESAKVTGLEEAKIGSINITRLPEVKIEVNPMQNIYNFIFTIIAAYIVMLVLFYLLPTSKERIDKVELKASPIFKNIGIGLLVLIVVPLASVIAMFTGVLTPIALITIVIYAIAIYLSTLLTSYVIGNLISDKLFKNNNVHLALILGIVLLKLVKLIPILGGWINAFAMFYGLGLIYKYITNRTK